MRYDPAYAKWNLNTNPTADNPLDYSGVWENHTFHPSPANWRMPFYTLMLDRWVNGDPSNDNANGTVFEQDSYETQLRHGGDVRGLLSSLDYLQGMGIKVGEHDLTFEACVNGRQFTLPGRSSSMPHQGLTDIL